MTETTPEAAGMNHGENAAELARQTGMKAALQDMSTASMRAMPQAWRRCSRPMR